MLHDAVDKCPADVWDGGEHTNSFWQVAYHALYFTHLYLQPEMDAFVPWDDHQSEVQHEDGLTGPADPDDDLPLIPEPYTKAQVLAYCDICDEMVDEAVGALDLTGQESGFERYPMPKLEHQFVNLRHLQHHAGQLADRLRNEAGVGVDWVGWRRTGG
jgi:hypothetical protein